MGLAYMFIIKKRKGSSKGNSRNDVENTVFKRKIRTNTYCKTWGVTVFLKIFGSPFRIYKIKFQSFSLLTENLQPDFD